MRARKLTFRYVGALLTVAGLLIAGQLIIQHDLERQEGDARIVNLAGRQRMLGQRLCLLLLALDRAPPSGEARGVVADRAELARVADEWQRSQRALRSDADEDAGGDEDGLAALFAQIEPDHQAMLAAARDALAGPARGSPTALARAHEAAFLAGMDRIVRGYEHAARRRVVELRRVELALLVLVLGVLAFEGLFVFRPAVRGLRAYLAARDAAERAERLERELVHVADREQMRLAQDLHDGLSQQLVGVAFLLRALRRDLSGSAGARADEVAAQLGEAIDQARGVARGLSSRTLEVHGLAAALDELAAHTARTFGIACRVAGDLDVEPAPVERAHLHRIAREAVLNAAKHARATTIDIALARDGAQLVLSVRDDGVGIARDRAAARDAGLGLHMMDYRARAMGASLEIIAGSGTTVTCRLPRHALAEAA